MEKLLDYNIKSELGLKSKDNSVEAYIKGKRHERAKKAKAREHRIARYKEKANELVKS